MPTRSKASPKPEENKSLDQWAWGAHLRRAQRARKVMPRRKRPNQSWIWDAACSIRGEKDAPNYKDYILPLLFTKRLCDVFDDTAPRASASFPTGGKLQSMPEGQDNLNRIAAGVGARKKEFQLPKRDPKLIRFFLPLEPADPEQPVWSVIRMLADKIGEGVTSHMRAIANENPPLQGIIDRIVFNATTHGQRDIDDDRLSNLIEKISEKRLGLDDVEADITFLQ